MSNTILLLASNPTDSARLRVDQELRDIRGGLERAKHRSRLRIEARSAVRRQDVLHAVIDLKPTVVHFCGHGFKGFKHDGLMFEDNDGRKIKVGAKALEAFFKVFSNHVRCVVLNACHSSRQAEAISQHVDFVIGMSQEISDSAALTYAVAFYDALGAGFTVKESHALGTNAIQWTRLDEHQTPRLYSRSGASEYLWSLEPHGCSAPYLKDQGPVKKVHAGSLAGHHTFRTGRQLRATRFAVVLTMAVFTWVGMREVGLLPLGTNFSSERPSFPLLYAVRIQILDPQGAPIEGAAVRASTGNEPHLLPDGWWQVEIPSAKVPQNRGVSFWAEHPLWQNNRGTLRLLEDPNPSLEIRLRFPSTQISGLVVDSESRGLENVRVRARDGISESVLTDREGRFKFDVPVAPGQRIRIHFQHSAYSSKDVHCYAGRSDCSAVLSRRLR